MDNINILLLGAGNRVSLAEWLIAAGETYGKQVKLFSLETDPLVPISKYATILKGERWSSPKFQESLINTIEHLDIHIVLPLMCAACTALSACKTEVEKETGAWLVVSDHELCKTFEDKELSEAWFRSYGVRVPLGNKTFPSIFKSKKGYGSRDQFIVNNLSEYLRLVDSGKDLNDYIQQPFIKGREYTVDCYITRSEVVQGVVTRQRLAVVNGEVSKGVTVRKQPLIDEILHIIKLGKFEGPVTFQAIEEETTGQFYIIECNPRFGGGAPQSFKAGANYCECLIAECLGLELPDCSQWKEGLVMMRCNQEVWSTIPVTEI